MLYLIFFLVCISGILFHKSRFVRFTVGAYIFIIMALNYQNPDTHSYIAIYNNPDSAQEEIGFRLLCKFLGKLGLSYNVFHFVIVTIGLIFLVIGIIKISPNAKRYLGFIGGLYMLCPMMNDIVLVRSFLSGCVVIFAYSYLVNGQKTKYILWILLASTLHISALFWLLLLFVENYKPSKKIKVLVGICIILVYILLNASILQNILIRLGFSALKVNLWLNINGVSQRSYLYSIIYHAANTLCFSIVRHYIASYCPSREEYSIHLENVLIQTNNVLMINIILTALSDQFMRILWLAIIINTIYYADSLQYVIRLQKRTILKLIALIMPVGMFVYRMFIYTTPNGIIYFDYIFKDIIDHNLLSMLWI